MSVFKFKKFIIAQEESAMKVGTDGVLLGSWASCKGLNNILDVGCGTGLITLMLAQRNINAKITGIEIDKKASKEAQFNINNSDWHERLAIKNISVQNFTAEIKFDLIISNPPFFAANKSKGRRDIARHTNRLSFEELVQSSVNLLEHKGIFSIILPKLDEKYFCDIAGLYNLYPNRACDIKGSETSKVKRVMLEFSFIKSTMKRTKLIIEKSRHEYTNEYINLCKNFYLNM